MKRIFSTLSGRVIAALILGISITASLVIFMLIKVSEGIFIETYGRAQEKVFNQVEDNLEDKYEKVYKVITDIENDWSFNVLFNPKFKRNNQSDREEFHSIYQFQKDMAGIIGPALDNQKIMIIGVEGDTFIYNGDIIACTPEEILQDEVTKSAMENPDSVNYRLRQGGFTQSTREGNMLIGVKACIDDGKPFAYIYITFTQEELAENYDFFCASNTDFYMVDENGVVAVSNDKSMLGQVYNESLVLDEVCGTLRKTCNTKGDKHTVIASKLKYSDYYIYGVIDNSAALKELYKVKPVVAICIALTVLIAVVTTLIIKKAMRPVKLMSDKMSKITENGKVDDDDKYMAVEGTRDIQILAESYNHMLDDLRLYIDAMDSAQSEKRKAEIKALQMQINPHYVYNTLASIKWLIWSREVDKSIKTIDAFIALLRNTISNTDEYITVAQERENITNYMWINSIRYGERIKTDFFVVPECEECVLPKMILQPFVENSFFHGFPNEEAGSIQIFVRPADDMLLVEIKDDGVGMSKDLVDTVKEKKHFDNYSGIGIHNVNERLKLLYGDEQSVEIESALGQGTAVRIRLKMVKKTAKI